MKARTKNTICKLLIVIALISAIGSSTASAQLYVNYSNCIAVFSAYGIPVNTALISNLSEPQGIAISGTNLFVANGGNGMIGEYSLSGQIINPSFILGPGTPEGIAIFGTNLCCQVFGNYAYFFSTTSGRVDGSLKLQALNGVGVALGGTNLYTTCSGTNGNVGKFTTAGAAVNAFLITNLSYPSGIAVQGTNLFVTSLFKGTISEYSTSGAPIKVPLISGLSTANGLMSTRNLLYVMSKTGVVSLCTTDGSILNSNLFSVVLDGFDPYGIVAGPVTALGSAPVLSSTVSSSNLILAWSTNAPSYLLESSSFCSDWTTVTNIPIVSNGCYNIILPATNSSQYFRLHTINE